MAVTEVTRTWSSESGSFSKELTSSDLGSADHVEIYDVIVDDAANDNAYTVKNDSSVVQVGEQFGSTFLWCTNVAVTRESPLLFKAVVTYKSLPGDPSESNPLTQNAVVKWKTVKANGEIDEDADGVALATPNDEPVEGITRPFSDMAAELSQPFSSFSASSFYTFIDHVNSDSYLGWAPGTLKVDDITADPASFEVGGSVVEYYNVTVLILARNPIRTTAAKAWYNRRVLKGFLIEDGNGDIVHAKDANGENVTKPVYLATDGTQVTKDNAVWVEDKVLASVAFSGMGFRF